jgi:2-polyprenyl-6-methoxyphenol hydroxylase-like FAD-dependent oxidoreductase
MCRHREVRLASEPGAGAQRPAVVWRSVGKRAALRCPIGSWRRYGVDPGLPRLDLRCYTGSNSWSASCDRKLSPESRYALACHQGTNVKPESAEPEVLVVGGGPAGMAVAIELGRRGIATLVVDKDVEIDEGHPRAAQIQVRTMEIFRRWGIVSRLRDESLLPPQFGPTVTVGTSLTGREIATVPFFAVTGGPPGDISAEEGGWAPQFEFTRMMQDLARSFDSVRVLRGWRYVSSTQHHDGVTAVVEEVDGDGRLEVTSSYLVGADGGRGSVRHDLGIRYAGAADLARWLYIPFRAPSLADQLMIAPSVMYYLFTPAGPMVARPINSVRWDIQLAGLPADIDIESIDLPATVRSAIGRDDVEFDVGTPAWIGLHDLIVEQYRSGRVLLVGDAAHLIVHYGGHNGNTGIGDGFNLGWKLAAILRGWGGDGLLESYEVERRPVALRTRQTALASMSQTGEAMHEAASLGVSDGDTPDEVELRNRIRDAVETHAEHTWRATGVTLDQRYEDSPAVVPDGTVVPDWDSRILTSVVAPGHRAPHVFEAPDGTLLDAFGPEFTLLRLDGAIDDGSALIEAAESRGVPLTVLDRAGAQYLSAYGAALTLIRPDGHISWRGSRSPDDPLAIIDVARGATGVLEPAAA